MFESVTAYFILSGFGVLAFVLAMIYRHANKKVEGVNELALFGLFMTTATLGYSLLQDQNYTLARIVANTSAGLYYYFVGLAFLKLFRIRRGFKPLLILVSITLAAAIGVSVFQIALPERSFVLSALFATQLAAGLWLVNRFHASPFRFEVQVLVVILALNILGNMIIGISALLDNWGLSFLNFDIAIAIETILMMSLVTLVSLFISVVSARRRFNLERLANYDGLTNCLRRVTFVELAGRYALSTERPSYLLMIDIDHFKKVNDKFGHVTGDEALKHIAALLRATTRVNDLVGRYGGEEFIIFLPNVGSVEAALIAERIRRTVEHSPLVGEKQDIPLRVSIGMAKVTESINTAIDRADQALYAAKNRGRNKVIKWSEILNEKTPEVDHSALVI